jgi:hypothetical protein
MLIVMLRLCGRIDSIILERKRPANTSHCCNYSNLTLTRNIP